MVFKRLAGAPAVFVTQLPLDWIYYSNNYRNNCHHK